MNPKTLNVSIHANNHKPVKCGRLSSVLSDIEHPGVDTDPVEVSAQLLGDVGLAPGRQAHHTDHVGYEC